MCYGEYRGKREIKRFMRYVEARITEYVRDETYRIYVTRSLQLAPQNKSIAPTYSELINPKKEPEQTGEEVVLDIMTRAGLKFGD